MKTLRAAIYKNIASVLTNDDDFYRTPMNMILFTRVLSQYPSKGIWYQICDRLIHYLERNIRSIPIIIETMRDEGEDAELISNIEMLRKNQPIKTLQDVSQLCSILNDYVKYAKLLKTRDAFLQTMDLMDEDDANIHKLVDDAYQYAGEIVTAYNSVNISSTINQFDSDDVDGMKTGIAQAKDIRSAEKIILTGERGLNALLSPGYVAGSLYVYQGLPGCYKSGILLDGHVSTCKYNAHIKASLNGKTPISIYVTMENTMAQTIRRLWSLLYPNADMSMFTVDEICDMIKKELNVNGFRSVILYYGYREKSTADLANIIRSFNTDNSQVVAFFLDYIKRVRPGRTDAAVSSSEKTELHAIMNELKAIAAQFEIPVVTGHQLNRVAQQTIDGLQNGGFGGKSVEALKRSNTGTAFEVVEVADWIGGINIESDGESKYLVMKALKQRDKDGNDNISFDAIRHPFTGVNSFALRHDINEPCSVAVPLYTTRSISNHLAANI
jgi:replicative DNA helicase